MNGRVKLLIPALAAALLAACTNSPIHPTPLPSPSAPARFDYERDDELDDDLSRAGGSARVAEPA